MAPAFCNTPSTHWITGNPLRPHRHSISTNLRHKASSSPQPFTTTSILHPPSAPPSSPSQKLTPTTPPTSDEKAWQSLRSIIPFHTLRTLHKPGHYLGNEFGARHKPWTSTTIRFCLAYPDLYSIAMSSTGHIILYSCLNDSPNLLCDRAYLPSPDMQAALHTHNQRLFAVESHRPLTDFHVIGMSLSYELGATNCVKMLQLAGIPYTWGQRDALSHVFARGPPLVFAGGLTVTANPEPYADLFDFFSIGDGEQMLPEIGLAISKALTEDPLISRHDLLLHLAKTVKGVYVPRFYAPCPDGAVRPIRPDVPIRIQKRNALPEPWRATALVPVTDAVHDRLTVEIRRGCTRGCRFCLPGMVQRPARDVPPEDVVRTVLDGVRNTGYNEFSLLSLSCSDWLSLPSVGIQLKNDLKKQEEAISLSLGSQRVDRFNEDIAHVVGGLRQAGLTFAPEAGTQRMRDVINKGLTNEDLARGVKLAYDQGYNNVKLYFMINLPGETDEDVMGIADTIKWLQRICRNKGRRRLSVNVTISTFTPKAQTPFQWHSTAIEDVKRKQQMLMTALSKSKDVKFSMTDSMLSSMEDFIGRGDRRLGKVIIRAHELGAGMDAWWEKMNEAFNAWCQAIREAGLEWKYRRTENGEWNIAETEVEEIRGPRGWYEASRDGNLNRKNLLPKGTVVQDGHDTKTNSAWTQNGSTQSPLDRPLPWDHIDNGLDKGWLRDELMRALSETLTPDCAFHDCSSCGVCGEGLGNNITIPPPPVPKYEGVYSPSSDNVQKLRAAFKKRSAFAMASHLDLMRMFDRLLRKAKIPMSFSGAFSPHPKVVFAAALPFGATADEELVDFVLRKEMDAHEFGRRLMEHLPDGISLEWVQSIPVQSKKVSLFMRASHFVLAVEHDNAKTVNWMEVVERVMSSGPVEIEKVSKGGKKSIRDLRKMVYDMRIATAEEAAPVLEHIGVTNWPSNTGVIFCEAELLNEGALSPDGIINLINIVMATEDFHLLHSHRKKIVLADVPLITKKKDKSASDAGSSGSENSEGDQDILPVLTEAALAVKQ